jgi:cytochrome P450
MTLGPPPGPKGFAAIGFLSAGLVPSASVLERLRAKYGHTFRVVYPSGPMTFTGDPDALRALYSADPDTFDVFGLDATAPVFGKGSVAVTSGARHRRDRKLLTPPFHGGALRAYGPTIAAIASSATADWPSVGEFSMLATTQTITLEIMIRVVFGIQDDERVRRTREAVLELMASLHPALFFFPPLRHTFGGLGPWARNCRAVAALNRILSDEVAARKRAHTPGEDILGRLLTARYDDGSAMSEAELFDQLRGLLFAGHETTATVMAWAFYWLHRRRQVLARLLDEVDRLGRDPDPDALSALPYLDAVCQEALRLYPPVVEPARIPRAPFDLAGYAIAPGEGIRPSPMLLHTREDLYPDPHSFTPERFLARKFSVFEYAPFGGGARRCLGAALAQYEMKIVLGTLLAQHRLRLVSTRPIEHVRRGLTLGPEGGVPMVREGRRLTHARSVTHDETPGP